MSLQFALLDDREKAEAAEGRFGLLRSDGSRKPAWYATRHLCSLSAGATPHRSVRIAVPASPLLAGQRRSAVIAWDGVTLRLPQDIIALPFDHDAQPAVRTLAVWSALPVEGHNGRTATVRIDGWPGYGWPVAVGLCSGRLTDVPWARQGEALELTVALDDELLAIRLFR